jgi:hypothetical protein
VTATAMIVIIAAFTLILNGPARSLQELLIRGIRQRNRAACPTFSQQ